jgi:hypothetical protein
MSFDAEASPQRSQGPPLLLPPVLLAVEPLLVPLLPVEPLLVLLVLLLVLLVVPLVPLVPTAPPSSAVTPPPSVRLGPASAPPASVGVPPLYVGVGDGEGSVVVLLHAPVRPSTMRERVAAAPMVEMSFMKTSARVSMNRADAGGRGHPPRRGDRGRQFHGQRRESTGESRHAIRSLWGRMESPSRPFCSQSRRSVTSWLIATRR